MRNSALSSFATNSLNMIRMNVRGQSVWIGTNWRALGNKSMILWMTWWPFILMMIMTNSEMHNFHVYKVPLHQFQIELKDRKTGF